MQRGLYQPGWTRDVDARVAAQIELERQKSAPSVGQKKIDKSIAAPQADVGAQILAVTGVETDFEHTKKILDIVIENLDFLLDVSATDDPEEVLGLLTETQNLLASLESHFPRGEQLLGVALFESALDAHTSPSKEPPIEKLRWRFYSAKNKLKDVQEHLDDLELEDPSKMATYSCIAE